ncbi:MAG TPA: glycosyltransferase family 4 protein, partial [Chloroflexota bacterium]|nr:glycosyltransferase family 4 protein [Chloroflexota bacterium]
MPVRVLQLINATLDPRIEREIAADRQPRKDYLELQRALQADVIDLGALERRFWTRLVRRCAGTAIAQALLALTCCRQYDVVFVDRESAGFALAALLRLRRHRPRVTMIGHMLSPASKRVLFRFLRLNRWVDRLIVHSSLQQQVAEQELGVPPERTALLPYQADQRFWKPLAVAQRAQICSAGLEFRDYQTMLEAVAGLNVDVVIAAASHWSTHTGLPSARLLPPNVRMAALNYVALRHLYAESLFVVVPLQDVENQAGITTILEAMAMGKAVVVSHTRGQIDVVRDRRRVDRTNPRRPTQPEWARTLGATEEAAHGHTGIYVQPGDAAELRRAITFLLTHPEQARAMGANGRRLIEQTMGLDHYTARIRA